RVAIITADKLAFLAAHLGAIYAGAVSLPLNPRYTGEELCYFLDDSGARVAVACDQVRPLVEARRGSLSDLPVVVDDTTARNAPEGPFIEPDVSCDMPCLMIYSSGTTGRPKGVVHTHSNLAYSIRSLQAAWRVSPDDTVLNVLPLFHVHGLSFGV